VVKKKRAHNLLIKQARTRNYIKGREAHDKKASSITVVTSITMGWRQAYYRVKGDLARSTKERF